MAKMGAFAFVVRVRTSRFIPPFPTIPPDPGRIRRSKCAQECSKRRDLLAHRRPHPHSDQDCFGIVVSTMMALFEVKKKKSVLLYRRIQYQTRRPVAGLMSHLRMLKVWMATVVLSTKLVVVPGMAAGSSQTFTGNPREYRCICSQRLPNNSETTDRRIPRRRQHLQYQQYQWIATPPPLYFSFVVTPGQSSVRNGDAGIPSLLYRLQSGLPAHA